MTSSESAAPSGLLLSDELLFTSRITGTARSLGLVVQPVRTSAQLEEKARQQPPSCVILDLANPTLKVAELLRTLRASGPQPPYVVAYGSHVDTATLQAARNAGCDLVLPRSKFVDDLPSELPQWMQGKEVR
jgi:CheY-like chemotaxis protein